MDMKNLGSVKFSSASNDFLKSLRQSSQEQMTAQLLQVEEISSFIDDCITGINRSSKFAQCQELRNSIQELQTEIADTSIEKPAIEAKESAYQLSQLKEERLAQEKIKADLSKTYQELTEIRYDKEKEKAELQNNLKRRYNAILYVIKAYQSTLHSKITFESKDVFKWQFNSKEDVFFKIKKEGDSPASWQLIEIHPQLKFQKDIMKFINEKGDYQGLYWLFHFISKAFDNIAK